jgi:TPP-dependent pyruvate/acetoin dehydrogenase alpha subunit
VFALYAATREAVDRARRGDGPTLIEAVTYRLGGHNATDDGRRYRSEEEVATAATREPLKRLGAWLKAAGQLDDAKAKALDDELNTAIRAAITAEENVPAPALRSLIEDVYVHPPATLEAQLAELEHVRGAK